MKKYLGVLCLLLAGVLMLMLGMIVLEQGSENPVQGEEWCEAMVLKSNNEWTEQETRNFAKSCLYE